MALRWRCRLGPPSNVLKPSSAFLSTIVSNLDAHAIEVGEELTEAKRQEVATLVQWPVFAATRESIEAAISRLRAFADAPLLLSLARARDDRTARLARTGQVIDQCTRAGNRIVVDEARRTLATAVLLAGVAWDDPVAQNMVEIGAFCPLTSVDLQKRVGALFEVLLSEPD